MGNRIHKLVQGTIGNFQERLKLSTFSILSKTRAGRHSALHHDESSTACCKSLILRWISVTEFRQQCRNLAAFLTAAPAAAAAALEKASRFRYLQQQLSGPCWHGTCNRYGMTHPTLARLALGARVVWNGAPATIIDASYCQHTQCWLYDLLQHTGAIVQDVVHHEIAPIQPKEEPSHD